MSFFLLGANERIGKKNKLMKLSKLLDWSRVAKHLKGFHKNELHSLGGPKSYNNLSMFKAILLSQWYSLSDMSLEESLKVRLDFMLFTGFEIGEDVPDNSTLCRFRNKLIDKGLDETLFKEINHQLEEMNIKVKKAEGAIVDATIIESSARPRSTLIPPEHDRQERESPPSCTLRKSADPDAEWLIKGKKYYFGYKGFVLADADEGFISHVHVTPANRGESPELPKIIEHVQGGRLMADKAYSSKKNRRILKEKSIKDGIMHKATRNHPLRYSQKKFNRLISQKRFKIEQGFGTLKRRFRFNRASYMTKIKVEAQLRLKSMCFNLLKAINMVEFV